MSGIYRGPNSSVAAQFVNADGDKGDIVVSNSGALWTIDAGVVDDSKVSEISASKISNTASGNLTSTNVQSALVELQLDIDSKLAGSALSDHISDVSDAHDASAISNIPSGNLASTNVQSALNELQSDIDSRATSSQGALADSAVQPATIANMLETTDIGVSVQAYDADTAKTDVVQTFTAGQRGEVTALTDGTNIASNFNDSNFFSATLAGNRTLDNPSNLVAGQSGSIFITQDATGSRTLAYGSYWDFANGTVPSLSTAANSVDRLDYVVRTATSIHAVLSKAWS